jgi:hypothetical protein
MLSIMEQVRTPLGVIYKDLHIDKFVQTKSMYEFMKFVQISETINVRAAGAMI